MRISRFTLILSAIVSLLVTGASAGSGDPALIDAAKKAASTGKYSECVELYSKAIASGDWPRKTLSALYYSRGECYSFGQKAEQSWADADKAVELDPTNAQALNLRGIGRIRRKKVAEGVADLEKALELDPSFVWPHINLAEFYANYPDKKWRNGEKAVAHAQQALAAFPDNVLCISDLAAAQAELGDFDAAVATEETAVKKLTDQGATPARLAPYQKKLALFKARKPYRGDW